MAIFSCGFITGVLFERLLGLKGKYDGTIRVISKEEKTVYSLELDHDVEEISYKKKLTFKVDASGEGMDVR